MRTADIFVSYSREHSSLVDPIGKLLRVGERFIFHDQSSIQPGDEWEKALRAALTNAKLLVVFWCSHASKSVWVGKELELAAELEKKLVPVILDATPLPPYVGKFQWIDLRGMAKCGTPGPQTQAAPFFDSSVFAEELAGKMMERLAPTMPSELHTKAADVLLELSPKLTDMKRKFKAYYQDLEWSNAPSKADQSAAANASFNDAFNFMQAKRLLIPHDIRIELEQYLQAIKTIRHAFDSGQSKSKYRRSETETFDDYTGKAQKDLEALQPQYEKLHQMMQAFLGFPVK